MANERDENTAMELARLLGVVQEARRLGFRLVATEHMLMAAFSDPVVRTACRNNCDMQDVQTLVTQASKKRGRGYDPARSVPDTAAELTPQAAELMLQAGAMVAGLRSDERPSPAVFSAALGALIITLLRDTSDTAAHAIINELDLHTTADAIIARLARPLDGPIQPAPAPR